MRDVRDPAPKLAADSAAEMVDLARAAEASRQVLADAYAHDADAATVARLQQENQKRLEEMSGHVAHIAGGVPGRFTLWLLGVLATLVSALAFAVAVPLTSGALTIAVADRLVGGQARLDRILDAAARSAGARCWRRSSQPPA